MIKIGLHGASGKMGESIVNVLQNDEMAEISILHCIDEIKYQIPKNVIVTDSYDKLVQNCDIIIDFSIAVGTQNLLEYVLEHPKPLVIGTTGLNNHQFNLLKQASEKMPITYATNMSLGVAVLNTLVSKASKSLKDFDIEIVEQHHRYKKDAPSGTALTLGQSAANARGLELEDVRVSGRNGLIGQRSKDEIAIMSLRGGDIAGWHRVGFYNDGEFIELSHTATNRSTFAKGAVFVAKWCVNQKNALYSIYDCLGV